jgi:hypothetical protein
MLNLCNSGITAGGISITVHEEDVARKELCRRLGTFRQ